MRQNFRRDKIKKEEMRKKKQEEKRNKRLHKKDAIASPLIEGQALPLEVTNPDTVFPGQTVS